MVIIMVHEYLLLSNRGSRGSRNYSRDAFEDGKSVTFADSDNILREESAEYSLSEQLGDDSSLDNVLVEPDQPDVCISSQEYFDCCESQLSNLEPQENDSLHKNKPDIPNILSPAHTVDSECQNQTEGTLSPGDSLNEKCEELNSDRISEIKNVDSSDIAAESVSNSKFKVSIVNEESGVYQTPDKEPEHLITDSSKSNDNSNNLTSDS